jgi:hypothetical protein
MLAFQVTALRGQLEGQGLDDLTYIGTDAFDATGIQAEAAGGNNEGIAHTTHAFDQSPATGSTRCSPPTRPPTVRRSRAGRSPASTSTACCSASRASPTAVAPSPAEIGAGVAEIQGFEGFTGTEMGYAGTNGIPPSRSPSTGSSTASTPSSPRLGLIRCSAGCSVDGLTTNYGSISALA